MARPERFELPTLWFEGAQYKILSALLASLTRKRVIYLGLEVDRSWTEIPATSGDEQ